MEMEQDERMERAINRHVALLDALLGKGKDAPLHVIVLSEIYGLSTEEGMVIDALIKRLARKHAHFGSTIDRQQIRDYIREGT